MLGIAQAGKKALLLLAFSLVYSLPGSHNVFAAHLQSTYQLNYTGGVQTWTAPAKAKNITFEAKGAAGTTHTRECGGYSISDGGRGGKATGAFSINPQETFWIYVGGKPPNGSRSGGWNGGGVGGAFGYLSTWSCYGGQGGGGGGATDVRRGGTSFSNRIVVGAGGGGAGVQQRGEHGGGLVGEGFQGGAQGNLGPDGGTQTNGGKGGAINCPSGWPTNTYCSVNTYAGTAGGWGSGGNGGRRGGGGGGGWYGGGGGSDGCYQSAFPCGGAGGSSYVHPGAMSSSTSSGGGSSGNGQVAITILPNADLKAGTDGVNFSDGPIIADFGEKIYVRSYDTDFYGACQASMESGDTTFWVSATSSNNPISANGTTKSGNEVISGTRVYKVTCNPGNISDTVTVYYDPPPMVDIQVNNTNGPITVHKDEEFTLSWTATDSPTACSAATTPSASSFWFGLKEFEGSTTGSEPLTGTYTYWLECLNEIGTYEDSVTVEVVEPPGAFMVDLKANGSDGPVTVDIDEDFILSWLVDSPSPTEETTCHKSMLEGNTEFWSGGQEGLTGQQSGSEPSYQTREYQITCISTVGTNSDVVTVNFEPAQQTGVQFQIAVSSSPSGPWNFTGPNCDPSAWYSGLPAVAQSACGSGQYFRYRVKVERASGALPSPTLGEVRLRYE